MNGLPFPNVHLRGREIIAGTISGLEWDDASGEYGGWSSERVWGDISSFEDSLSVSYLFWFKRAKRWTGEI